jgi:hypothetical protein
MARWLLAPGYVISVESVWPAFGDGAGSLRSGDRLRYLRRACVGVMGSSNRSSTLMGTSPMSLVPTPDKASTHFSRRMRCYTKSGS